MLATVSAGAAWANEPHPWQMGLQTPGSPTARMIDEFHDALLVIITVITVFVLALMLYACVRFRESRNPTPSKTTHNTVLEVLWTAIPVVILTAIAIPSMKLLYFADHIEDGDMTLKVIGHQWYWSYEYPDYGNFTFDANMVPEKEAVEKGLKRLMATDNPVVLPVGKKIRLQFASTDVIHNWAVTSLGVRIDTTPGRLNETWVEIDRPGTYYGFCSELCGTNHAYMPIMIEAVSPEKFEAWTKEAQKKFARVDAPAKPVAERVDAPVSVAARGMSK